MTTRNEFIAQLKAKLDEWNAEIDELEAKARKKHAQATQAFNERYAELRVKRDEASTRLNELRSSADDAWQNLTSGTEAMWNDLQATLEDTKNALLEGAGRDA